MTDTANEAAELSQLEKRINALEARAKQLLAGLVVAVVAVVLLGYAAMSGGWVKAKKLRVTNLSVDTLKVDTLKGKRVHASGGIVVAAHSSIELKGEAGKTLIRAGWITLASGKAEANVTPTMVHLRQGKDVATLSSTGGSIMLSSGKHNMAILSAARSSLSVVSAHGNAGLGPKRFYMSHKEDNAGIFMEKESIRFHITRKMKGEERSIASSLGKDHATLQLKGEKNRRWGVGWVGPERLRNMPKKK